MQISNNSRGPGYADVAEALIEVSRVWGGQFKFLVTADRDRKGAARLFLVLERQRVDTTDGTRGSTRVWTPYPTANFRTFAAALHSLCYELDKRLDRARIERESQTSF